MNAHRLLTHAKIKYGLEKQSELKEQLYIKLYEEGINTSLKSVNW